MWLVVTEIKEALQHDFFKRTERFDKRPKHYIYLYSDVISLKDPIFALYITTGHVRMERAWLLFSNLKLLISRWQKCRQFYTI